MKRTGKHPEKALSAVAVRNLSKPGRYPDGNALYLVVEKTGAKRWILRTLIQGKRSDIGLGGLSLVSLSEAREKAAEYRKVARAGGDPLAEKRRAKEAALTFADAAERVHSEHKASWKNAKHAQQWINTLRQYANPVIGELALGGIDTPDIMRVLSPIWLAKPETARRVRQRLGTIFDWAKASGFRIGDNPIDGVSKGLPKQTDKDVHHAALPYADVPAFVSRLRTEDDTDIARLAFEFLVLTAARTGEVLGAQVSEVDLDNKLWTVPANRMKANVEHRVPLSGRSIAILRRAAELGPDSRFVFPGRSRNTPMSNMVFLMTLRRMDVKATAHGFRSSFRDWAAEATRFPREVAEMALAHTIDSKVEAAYRRGDLLEQRRVMMNAWASLVEGRPSNG